MGERRPLYGADRMGYLIFTREGRGTPHASREYIVDPSTQLSRKDRQRRCRQPGGAISRYNAAIFAQILAGVSGMSTCVMPSGESASTTALTTAGGSPMVPASPSPLAPSGLNGEGVSWCRISATGTSSARGI